MTLLGSIRRALVRSLRKESPNTITISRDQGIDTSYFTLAHTTITIMQLIHTHTHTYTLFPNCLAPNEHHTSNERRQQINRALKTNDKATSSNWLRNTNTYLHCHKFNSPRKQTNNKCAVARALLSTTMCQHTICAHILSLSIQIVLLALSNETNDVAVAYGAFDKSLLVANQCHCGHRHASHNMSIELHTKPSQTRQHPSSVQRRVYTIHTYYGYDDKA